MPKSKRIPLEYLRITDLIEGEHNDLIRRYAYELVCMGRDPQTGELLYQKEKASRRKVYVFDLTTDCNLRLSHAIPGNLTGAHYNAMAAGTPLLHMAIARQGASCFGEGRDKAEASDLVDRLLAQSAIDVNARGCYGETALHRAVEAMDFKTANTLVRKGIKVQAKNLNGETAFDHAIDKYCYMVNRGLSPIDELRVNCYELVRSTTSPGKTVPTVSELEVLAARRAKLAAERKAIREAQYRYRMFGEVIARSAGAVASTKSAEEVAADKVATAKLQSLVGAVDCYMRLRKDERTVSGHGRLRAESLKRAAFSADSIEALDEMAADLLATGYVKSLIGDGAGITLFKGASSATDKGSLRGRVAAAFNIDLKAHSSKEAIRAALLTDDSLASSVRGKGAGWRC